MVVGGETFDSGYIFCIYWNYALRKIGTCKHFILNTAAKLISYALNRERELQPLTSFQEQQL
jgi:hypothetical protein